MHDFSNTIFGRYCLLHLLGRGASSEVYLGEHIYLKTFFAIKILQTRLSEKESENFRREAQLLARLRHPNIVTAHDYDVENGYPFIVMDYAYNGTLRKRYPRGTRVPTADIMRYVTQVADALQYAHDRERLVHRDVKPENMLLGPNNEIWLSDFGISLVMPTSRSLTLQEMAGTVQYMAPEQVRARPGFASDQYSLGIVVYEWLCGSCPFNGSLTEVTVQHLYAEPPPLRAKVPTISPAVEAVVLRALAKQPQERFPTVRAFADALNDAFEQASTIVATDMPQPRPGVLLSNVWLPTLPDQNDSGASVPPMSQAATPPPADNNSLYDTEAALSTDKIPVREQQSSALPLAERAMTNDLPSAQVVRLPRHTVSRRSLLIGLGSLIVVAGAGAMAFEQDIARELQVKAAAPASNSAHVNKQTRLPTSKESQPSPTPAAAGTTLYTYTGHTGAVKGVAWLSDQRMASGGLDDTVQVWDALTGGHVLKYQQHGNGIKTIASSPSGRYVASGDQSGKIHVWNAVTGDDLFAPLSDGQAAPPGGDIYVRSVAWSPDSNFIVSGSDDKIVTIWSAQSGNRIFTYTGHGGPVRGVSWSPNGQLIASGGMDRTVQIWHVTSGASLYTYRGHSDIVWCVAWSPDGKHVASASQDGTVQIWEATTGALLAKHPVSAPALTAVSVCWSPDGKYVAGGSNQGTVQIWNATTGQLVLTYHQQSGVIWSLAWSPQGQYIASGADDKTVKVWQAP
jgi:WD40 repeat protein/serine/threonine protein kinase